MIRMKDKAPFERYEDVPIWGQDAWQDYPDPLIHSLRWLQARRFRCDFCGREWVPSWEGGAVAAHESMTAHEDALHRVYSFDPLVDRAADPR